MHAVYFIGQVIPRKKGTKPIKIGNSGCISARMKTLQTASPHDLRLIACALCDSRQEAETLERTIHWVARKRNKRLSGEWFLIYEPIEKLFEFAIRSCRIKAALIRVSVEEADRIMLENYQYTGLDEQSVSERLDIATMALWREEGFLCSSAD